MNGYAPTRSTTLGPLRGIRSGLRTRLSPGLACGNLPLKLTTFFLFFFLGGVGFHPSVAAAQEADVRAAVEQTLAAWTAGDFETAATHYDAEVRGYFLDGGGLVTGFNPQALRAAFDAGVQANLSIQQMDVSVRDNVAVVAGRLTGSITMPGGGQTSGVWRYTETRVRSGGVWKVIQYHFSPANQGG